MNRMAVFVGKRPGLARPLLLAAAVLVEACKGSGGSGY
jgi:hypothetical protein